MFKSDIKPINLSEIVSTQLLKSSHAKPPISASTAGRSSGHSNASTLPLVTLRCASMTLHSAFFTMLPGGGANAISCKDQMVDQNSGSNSQERKVELGRGQCPGLYPRRQGLSESSPAAPALHSKSSNQCLMACGRSTSTRCPASQ